MGLILTGQAGSVRGDYAHPVYVVEVLQRLVNWLTKTSFDKGSHVDTEVDGTGEASVVQLNELADGDDSIPYTTPANYTLSDGAKLEIDGGLAKLKALTGGSYNWPFTTPANYTYNAAEVEVTGGNAGIKDNRTYATFDGSNECAIVGDKANLDFGTGNFSVSFWIKTSSNANAQIIGKQDTGSGWYIYVNNATSTVYFLHRKDSKYVTSSTTISDGAWHSVVFTRSGATGKIYVDGTDDTGSSHDISASVDSSGDPCEFARRNLAGSPDRHLAGSLDSIAIWDKALGQAEVTDIHNSGVPGDLTAHSAYSANCVSYWPVGDGDTFPTLTDNKDSNNAALTNMEAGDISTDINDPTIYPVTGYAFSSALSAFAETSTKPGASEIKYHCSSDDGVTWKYWTGAAWAVTDDSYAQANTAAEVHTNIAALAGSGTFKFRALLHCADSMTTPLLDSINVSEPSTYSTTDNLYVDTKDAAQIAPSTVYEWLTAVIASTIPGNTDVRILFSVDGRANWLTWSGSAWVAPTSPTARTDATALTDAATNFGDLPVGDGTLDVRLFLYTSGATATPSVSNVQVTSDAGYELTGTYTSNEYDSTYIDLAWSTVDIDVTTPGGCTATIKARAGNESGNLDAWSAALTDGDALSVVGRYLQWEVAFTTTGPATATINSVGFHMVSPAEIEVQP